MTKKETFIKEVKDLIEKAGEGLSEDAQTYFDALQASDDKQKPKFTENGKLVLQYIKDNKDEMNNMFKAKDVAEGLGLSSRTVSGASRKLVTDGYLEKVGENPVIYSLTDLGAEADLSAE